MNIKNNKEYTMENVTKNVHVHQSQKSVPVALMFTFFFGPLGMFYVSPMSAMISFGTCFIASLTGFLLGGVGIFVTLPLWFMANMTWAVYSIKKQNLKSIEDISKSINEKEVNNENNASYSNSDAA